MTDQPATAPQGGVSSELAAPDVPMTDAPSGETAAPAVSGQERGDPPGPGRESKRCLIDLVCARCSGPRPQPGASQVCRAVCGSHQRVRRLEHLDPAAGRCRQAGEPGRPPHSRAEGALGGCSARACTAVGALGPSGSDRAGPASPPCIARAPRHRARPPTPPQDDLGRIRQAFDAFLAEYPLCYGYWKKYGDAERRHGDLQQAVAVFERGVAAVPYSAELWIHYAASLTASGSSADDVRR